MHILKSKKLSDQELLDLAISFSSKTEGSLEEKILHWEFGPIMTMKLEDEAKNYLFSSDEVPFHWDGAFFKEPRLLLFYCLESSGEGGETLFCDTTKLWNSLSSSEQEECKKVELKYSTQKIAHYGGSFKTPLVCHHPASGEVILRFAESVETSKNPVELEIMGTERSSEFYNEMKERLYDPRFLYEHRWEAGDIVICDNFTYLHGRRALGNNLGRTFKRIQIL